MQFPPTILSLDDKRTKNPALSLKVAKDAKLGVGLTVPALPSSCRIADSHASYLLIW
jgi:hypothetical protein